MGFPLPNGQTKPSRRENGRILLPCLGGLKHQPKQKRLLVPVSLLGVLGRCDLQPMAPPNVWDGGELHAYFRSMCRLEEPKVASSLAGLEGRDRVRGGLTHHQRPANVSISSCWLSVCSSG